MDYDQDYSVEIEISPSSDHPNVYCCRLILGPGKNLRRVRIRIDQPRHVGGAGHGQQEHGHVQEQRRGRWVDTQVINRDGTGSHGTKRGEKIRSDVAGVLRERGWTISDDNVVKLMTPRLLDLMIAAIEFVPSETDRIFLEVFIADDEQVEPSRE